MSSILAGFVMLLYRMYTNQRQMHQALLRARVRLRQSDSNSARSPSRSQSPSLPSSVPSPVPPPSDPQSPPPTPGAQSLFEALAKDARAAKKRKHAESVLGIANLNPYDLEVPANARLKYHVYVKDKTDGSDLAAPTTYWHTDYMIARGAFSGLKSAFEAAGQVPIFEIQTPSGRKSVTNEDEWERAVFSIYNVRRSGGVVEVDVFV